MFYEVVRGLLRFFFSLYFRWEIEGKDKVPAEGGFILVGNHVSYLDPPVMGCAIDRTVHFMAKAELFSIPVLGQAIRALHAFPVRRGSGDRQAIRRALEILAMGEVLAMFPEGTRSRDGQLLPAQGGAAMLALKAGVPIVPVAIIGTEKVVPKGKLFPRPAKVRVRIGDPIVIKRPERVDKEMIANLSSALMRAVANLLAA